MAVPSHRLWSIMMLQMEVEQKYLVFLSIDRLSVMRTHPHLRPLVLPSVYQNRDSPLQQDVL